MTSTTNFSTTSTTKYLGKKWKTLFCWEEQHNMTMLHVEFLLPQFQSNKRQNALRPGLASYQVVRNMPVAASITCILHTGLSGCWHHQGVVGSIHVHRRIHKIPKIIESFLEIVIGGQKKAKIFKSRKLFLVLSV
jgi:hypothetical protein